MTRLILRLMAAMLTFGFGVALERFFISSKPAEVPRVQSAERCDPSHIEARTISVPPPPAPSPSPHAILDFDPAKFEPYGDYFILGKTPKELAEFRTLLISSYQQDAKLHGYVWLQTRANKTYELHAPTFALVTKRRLLIVTPPSSGNGFEYRFDGEFLHQDLNKFANKSKGVLRGTLTKVKDGRKLAERLITLRVERHEGC